MSQSFDASRSLAALEQDNSIVAVIGNEQGEVASLIQQVKVKRFELFRVSWL